ncbi:MAG TPA: hypothetical protein VIF09_02325 [Polyangiaceae bacterium]
MTPRRERVVDALVLVLAKLAVTGWVLHLGFSHVSDDDYARTVIAEQFAHAPRLDPSGTSWLPLPFWLEGAAMMALGRTLATARAVAVVLAAASVAAPYLALRAAGAKRTVAIASVVVAMVLPWNAWLAAATVPEAWFGALAAAGAIAMGQARTRPWAAGMLLAASLCRYEAWPVCALLALACAWSADGGGKRRRDLACLAVAVLGPLAWMAWNAHAHGSPFHFVTRVTTFRHAVGAADRSLVEKVFGYPVALIEESPEAFVLGLVGLAGLSLPALRARWRWPAVAIASVLLFLVWGDVQDGAPTHHPARALAIAWWVLAAMGVDAVDAWGERLGRRRRTAVVAAAATACVWSASLPARWADSPGRSDAESRRAQIAQGLDLRARDVPHIEVRPCAFEQFAVLAAWGYPERATVLPRSGEPVTPACPRIVER